MRNDITVFGTYIDRALSAKTDNHSEFQRMIKDSYRKLFDFAFVVVKAYAKIQYLCLNDNYENGKQGMWQLKALIASSEFVLHCHFSTIDNKSKIVLRLVFLFLLSMAEITRDPPAEKRFAFCHAARDCTVGVPYRQSL